jgi:hypothetical protein
MQMIIAVALFLVCHATGVIQVPISRLDKATLIALGPMILLNVVGLTCVALSLYTMLMLMLHVTPQRKQLHAEIR